MRTHSRPLSLLKASWAVHELRLGEFGGRPPVDARNSSLFDRNRKRNPEHARSRRLATKAELNSSREQPDLPNSAPPHSDVPRDHITPGCAQDIPTTEHPQPSQAAESLCKPTARDAKGLRWWSARHEGRKLHRAVAQHLCSSLREPTYIDLRGQGPIFGHEGLLWRQRLDVRKSRAAQLQWTPVAKVFVGC